MTAQQDAAEVLAAKVLYGAHVSDHAARTAPEIMALCEDAARALAAAGLLVTPEHDAQVAARALREAADDMYATEFAYDGSRQWLHDRADRIERQEDER